MTEEQKKEIKEVDGLYVGEFKGNPILYLNLNDFKPFSFGIQKAKLILENISKIEKFVKDYEVVADYKNKIT